MNADYTVVFQNLLYKKPLYDYIGRSEQNMNILVLGWNEATEAFVNQCLQAGQMDSHMLQVTVLTENSQDAMNDYLQNKPALAQFVNVNGSLSGSDLESYAVLNFENYDNFIILTDGSTEKREEEILTILTNAPDEKYHYFLVAVGTDAQNYQLAKDVAIVMEELFPLDRKAIAYTVDNNPGQLPKSVFPVCLNGTHTVSEINPELERIAFNCHLAWGDAINGDAQTEFQKFKADKYNYMSSVSFALSIKYKLADLKIDYDDIGGAAERVFQMLHVEQNSELLYRIIALEHRRWVIDLAVQGWSAPEDAAAYYDECIRNCSVKDKERKIHPCIVRSTSATPLQAFPYTDKENWDNVNLEEDALLDPLDRMSIELHRKMRDKAYAFKQSNPFASGHILNIRAILTTVARAASNKLIREMERYFFALKNILDGSWAYSKQYAQYKTKFVEVLEKENFRDRFAVISEIEQIDAEFFPVLECNLYRDYKMYDEVLVKKIPFILTYKTDLTMVSTFRVSSSLNDMTNKIFQNVAAATVIKPKEIIFLLLLDDMKITSVRKAFHSALWFLAKKNVHCEITLLIAGTHSKLKGDVTKWKKWAERLKVDGNIRDYVLSMAEDEDEVIHTWTTQLSGLKIDLFDGTYNIFPSMRANGKFVQQIQEKYPYFEFNSRSKTFRNNQQCRFLSYIDDRTYLSIDEMFGLSDASAMEYNYPVLGSEINRLWDVYTDKFKILPGRWKNENERIGYSIRCWNALCDTLEEYCRRNPTTDELIVDDLKSMYKGKQDWHDIIMIIGVLCGENRDSQNNGEYKQYLIPKKQGDQIFSFRFSSPDLKQLLTKAGEILEVYTYFAIAKTGLFDEVACSYHFTWGGDVSNELDLVLVSGFQSIIVEAKAESRLDQNYYFKLDSLVEMFGVGTKKVILTTANMNYNNNHLQKTRGELMGITTISDLDEFQNIGEKLKKLIN